MTLTKEYLFKLLCLLLVGLFLFFYLRQSNENKKRAYTAQRARDCLAVYKTEASEWDNVLEYNYNQQTDDCEIKYAVDREKHILYRDINCEELRNPDLKAECISKGGTFTKIF